MSKHFDKKKKFTEYEIKVMVQKQVKKALKQKKRKYTEELRALEKMRVSNSDQESMNSSSSKAKFENKAQASYIILTIIIVA